jgi:hypothetical protein
MHSGLIVAGQNKGITEKRTFTCSINPLRLLTRNNYAGKHGR